MKIDEGQAVALLREAAAAVDAGKAVNRKWRERIERFSQLCEASGIKTHVAFLGTAILARAVTREADLFACKPELAPDNPRAYSARTLSEDVLVPWSATLALSIGATGRQPLNNQPYFRMTRLDDGTPLQRRSEEPFQFMLELVRILQDAHEGEARDALRAFVAVRRTYQRSYDAATDDTAITPVALLAMLREFGAKSEGGKRAQAAVAGVLDVVYPGRVESGRINDPSRRDPGDVRVRSSVDGGGWEKAIEVRDKPVSLSDVAVFARECTEKGAQDASVVMVARAQTVIAIADVDELASRYGVSVTLFFGWAEFLGQALYWAGPHKGKAAELAAACVRERLIAIEVDPRSVSEWDALMAAHGTGRE